MMGYDRYYTVVTVSFPVRTKRPVNIADKAKSMASMKNNVTVVFGNSLSNHIA